MKQIFTDTWQCQCPPRPMGGGKQVENSTYSISYPMSPKNLQYKPLKVCLVFETVKGNYAINLWVNVSPRDRFSTDSGLLEMFYKWT